MNLYDIQGDGMNPAPEDRGHLANELYEINGLSQNDRFKSF